MLTIIDENKKVLDRTRSLKKGVMAASLDVSFSLLPHDEQMYEPLPRFGHMFTASHDSEELSFFETIV